MTDEMYKRLDNIIEDYMRNKFIFLSVNSDFFYKLYKTKAPINVQLNSYEYEKSSATKTFDKISEYYSTYFSDKLKEIKEAFDSGKFDIKYRDENLELEDNYLCNRNEIVFYENKKIINIPLLGDTRDIMISAHEIRHHLNDPKEESRNLINDLLTEGLSQFEEYLILEYLYSNNEISINDRKRFYLETVYKFNEIRNMMIFVLELIQMKQKLGVINKKNYSFLFSHNTEVFDQNCIILLNNIKDFEKDNWHLLGHFLNAYMIEKYEENNNFIEKYKKLNDLLLENSGIECLNTIDLDFYDEKDTIKKLSHSMKYIEDKILRGKSK